MYTKLELLFKTTLHLAAIKICYMYFVLHLFKCLHNKYRLHVLLITDLFYILMTTFSELFKSTIDTQQALKTWIS